MTPNSDRINSPNRSLRSRRILFLLLGVFVIPIFVLILLPAAIAGADPVYTDRDVLVASTYASDSETEVGRGVATSGDTVVVGAPAADGDIGAVYVYMRPASGWTTSTMRSETAKLSVHDLGYDSSFGEAVAISGDTIVVGAENFSTAYVFVRSGPTWTSTDQPDAKLTTLAAAGLEFFGDSVAISGDTIVVGAPLSNSNGEAFVFVKPPSGWVTATQTAKLTNAAGASEDDFGSSVAVNGDTIVVGAQLDDIGENGSTQINQGSAYVYVKPSSGWVDDSSPDAHLTASTGATFEYFGASVAIREDGEVVVVGAPDAERPVIAATKSLNVISPTQGAAFVFMRPGSGWITATEDAVLSSGPGGEDYDKFGGSVSISNDTIVVGAYQYGVDDKGAAFAYVQPNVGIAAESWESTETPTAVFSDTAGTESGDSFGDSVAVFGGTIVAGVPLLDLSTTNGASASVIAEKQGAAYVYENEYCTRVDGGNWHTGDTWVGGAVPPDDADVCVSTGHTVNMDSVTTFAPTVYDPSPVPMRRLLVNPGGVLDLNMYDIEVDEAVSNNGTLKQSKAQLAVPGSVEILQIDNIGGSSTIYRGANISSTHDLGSIAVSIRETVDWFSPTDTYAYCTETGALSPSYTGRCFDITPTNNDLTSTVKLWIMSEDLNGVAVTDLSLYRRVGDLFEKLTNQSNSSPASGFIGYEWAQGSTPGFSSFLVGDANDDPTSINLLGLNVSSGLAFSTFFLMVVLLLGGISAAVVLRLRRKEV